MKNHYTIGIVLTNNFELSNFKDYLKKEGYKFKKEELKNLKPAYLFNLDDSLRYYAFEADAVIYDDKNNTYYHLSTVDILKPEDTKDIFGFVDSESCEIELI